MNNVFELRGKCTGCAACAVACPSNAILMKKNDKGFFAPTIISDKCVSCGLCKKVCEKETPFSKTPHLANYALQAKNKSLLLESSSGGVASTLSEQYVSKGNYVIGAFFNLQENIVDTKASNRVDEIQIFKTSKYLQSNFYCGLSSAIKIAKKDKTSKFLVFGTPCQIAGAVNVCEFYHVNDQFTFVDFFCHGVPSYLAWEYYLKDKKIDPDILQYVSFRNKKNGWHSCFAMEIKDNKKELFIPSGKDTFYNAFFDNVFLMDSCYKCKFRKGYSKSDIRLGDYWGGRYSSNEDGVSSALVYTNKGLELINDGGFSVLPSGNDLFDAQSTKDYQEEQYREKAFSSLLKNKSLKKAIKQYRKLFSFKVRVKLFGKKTIYTFLPIKLINKLKGKKWKRTK